MKTTTAAAAALAILTASPALAVDTTKVYSSGFLVVAFLGFCALIIVAQFGPVVMLLSGMLKSLANIVRAKEAVQAEKK